MFDANVFGLARSERLKFQGAFNQLPVKHVADVAHRHYVGYPKFVSNRPENGFGAVLFELNNSEQGRRVLQRLQISRFESASDSTYVPVRNFLNAFSTTVRPVER